MRVRFRVGFRFMVMFRITVRKGLGFVKIYENITHYMCGLGLGLALGLRLQSVLGLGLGVWVRVKIRC